MLLKKVLAICAFGIMSGCRAQLVTDFNPPRADCCLVGAAQNLADQLTDWNQLGRYHAANGELLKKPVEPARVVFMGDSITDSWSLGEAFPGQPYVNRGISGQTTAQMLVRMYPDVIALQPHAVVILAGTNDIAGNNGPQSLEMVEQNLMAMAELARVHNIKVILCALTPISDKSVSGRRQSTSRPPADILKLNAWLKEYAAKNQFPYADYYSAVVDGKGELRTELSEDGLHPNARGYQLMKAVIATILKE